MIRFSVNLDPTNDVTRVKSFPEDSGPILVGREKDCQLRLRNNSVSRKHCIIEYSGNGYFIEDQGSTQGTTINGEHLPPLVTTPLHHGDVLQIGEVEVTVAILEDPDDAEQISNAAHDAVADLLGKMVPGSSNDSTAYVKILNGEDEGVKFLLVGQTAWIIGRQTDCDFVINNPNVSRKQARISLEDGSYYLIDLDSQHGTEVNGVKIERKHRLVHLDRFTMGSCKAIFYEPAQELLSALEYIEQANENSQTKAIDPKLLESKAPATPHNKELPPSSQPVTTPDVDVYAILTDDELENGPHGTARITAEPSQAAATLPEVQAPDVAQTEGSQSVTTMPEAKAVSVEESALGLSTTPEAPAVVVSEPSQAASTLPEVQAPAIPEIATPPQPAPIKPATTVAGGGNGRRRRRGGTADESGLSSPGSVSTTHSRTQPPVFEAAPPPTVTPVPERNPDVIVNNPDDPGALPIIVRDHYDESLWLPRTISIVCFIISALGIIYLIWG